MESIQIVRRTRLRKGTELETGERNERTLGLRKGSQPAQNSFTQLGLEVAINRSVSV